MKYLVIYSDGDSDAVAMEVWDFKGDDLATFMEGSWNRGEIAPIIIPVKDVKNILSKKGVRVIPKDGAMFGGDTGVDADY